MLLGHIGSSAGARCRAFDVATFEQGRVLAAAEKFLAELPQTLTSFPAPRSTGGLHEYFSEGDYWWPDPKDPERPYIRRDGMTNPDNFVAHRRALIRFSVQVASLTAAYEITGEKRFAAHAAQHVRAWFLQDATRMYPHVKYAQAIKGRVTGRGVGIIDTIHLVEVAQAIGILKSAGVMSDEELEGVKEWFRTYLEWLTTHPYGVEEREAKNNHGTCWVLQVAAFAALVGDGEKLEYCRTRFRSVLVPNQMSADGGFPLELKRTKPFGYSLFNLDAMAAICQILSTPAENLWEFQLDDGRGMKKAMEFIYPFIVDKSSWPYPPDVTYFENWPVRQVSLLFAGLALNTPEYVELWKRLDPDPTQEEVVRNFPIRQPVLWIQ